MKVHRSMHKRDGLRAKSSIGGNSKLSQKALYAYSNEDVSSEEDNDQREDEIINRSFPLMNETKIGTKQNIFKVDGESKSIWSNESKKFFGFSHKSSSLDAQRRKGAWGSTTMDPVSTHSTHVASQAAPPTLAPTSVFRSAALASSGIRWSPVDPDMVVVPKSQLQQQNTVNESSQSLHEATREHSSGGEQGKEGMESKTEISVYSHKNEHASGQDLEVKGEMTENVVEEGYKHQDSIKECSEETHQMGKSYADEIQNLDEKPIKPLLEDIAEREENIQDVVRGQDKHPTLDVVSPGDLLHTIFFRYIMAVDISRDYTIIVDRSTSMKLQGRWKEAEAAVSSICDATCLVNVEGVTLYFFSSPSQTHHGETSYFVRYDNVKTSKEIIEKFRLSSNQPRGGTDLTKVLDDAIYPPGVKPQSLLVITDGRPDHPEATDDLIIRKCNALLCESDLSITLVQVGDDQKGNDYLHDLDTKLTEKGARYDIVDMASYKMMQSHHGDKFCFSQVVQTAMSSVAEQVKSVIQTTKQAAMVNYEMTEPKEIDLLTRQHVNTIFTLDTPGKSSFQRKPSISVEMDVDEFERVRQLYEKVHHRELSEGKIEPSSVDRKPSIHLELDPDEYEKLKQLYEKAQADRSLDDAVVISEKLEMEEMCTHVPFKSQIDPVVRDTPLSIEAARKEKDAQAAAEKLRAEIQRLQKAEAKANAEKDHLRAKKKLEAEALARAKAAEDEADALKRTLAAAAAAVARAEAEREALEASALVKAEELLDQADSDGTIAINYSQFPFCLFNVNESEETKIAPWTNFEIYYSAFLHAELCLTKKLKSLHNPKAFLHRRQVLYWSIFQVYGNTHTGISTKTIGLPQLIRVLKDATLLDRAPSISSTSGAVFNFDIGKERLRIKKLSVPQLELEVKRLKKSW